MNELAQGLILRQTDFREADVMITVLTRDYGKISFSVRGVRRMTSKNAGSVIPYTMGEFQFDYKQDRSVFRLKTARTKKFYMHMHQDLIASAAAAYAAQIAEEMNLAGSETEHPAEQFGMLETCFDLFESGMDTHTVLALYLSDVMKLFGIAPSADGCAVCGSPRVTSLSVSEGGFLCAEHAAARHLPVLDTADLKRFRLIAKGGLKHADIIAEAGGAELKDLVILKEILKHHTGIEIRSAAFYERLFVVD